MLNRLRATHKMSRTFGNCYVMIDSVTFTTTRQLCSCKEHKVGIALHYITLRGTTRFVQDTDQGHNNKVLGRWAVNDRAKWRQPC